MSCCGSGPAGMFPDPNSRSANGRAYQYNNPRRGANPPGRSTFHSARLRRASAIVQDPTSVSLREVVVFLFAAFVLYRGFFTARDLRDLVFRRRVSDVCLVAADGAACLATYLNRVWFVHLWRLAADVVPWGVVVAAAVFVGELALASMRG
ncbi:hypothetical protein RB598_008993 [Gaeumannomyces tritici]